MDHDRGGNMTDPVSKHIHLTGTSGTSIEDGKVHQWQTTIRVGFTPGA